MQLSQKRYKTLKDLIFLLDNGKCHICKKKVAFKRMVLDHIIPVAVCGRAPFVAPEEYWNFRMAHRDCNIKRSNGKIAGQIRLPLSYGS